MAREVRTLCSCPYIYTYITFFCVRKHTQLSGQSVLGYIDPWGGAVLRRDTKCCSPKVRHSVPCLSRPRTQHLDGSLIITQCRRKALELEDPFNQTSISTWSIGLRTCIIEDRDEVECKPGPKYMHRYFVFGLEPMTDSRTFVQKLQIRRSSSSSSLRNLSKTNKNYLCSTACPKQALDHAPVLLSIYIGHQAPEAETSTPTN